MKRFALRICSCVIVSLMAVSIVACGGSDDEAKKKAKDATPSTVATTKATPTPAPTYPTYSGPMTNDVAISWQETDLEGGPTVMYVKCTDYINVRKGPGTEYEPVVAKLANNMKVVVTAKTNGNWYRTQDGFYVSGELLSATPST